MRIIATIVKAPTLITMVESIIGYNSIDSIFDGNFISCQKTMLKGELIIWRTKNQAR
jgi:hypothetical protein